MRFISKHHAVLTCGFTVADRLCSVLIRWNAVIMTEILFSSCHASSWYATFSKCLCFDLHGM